MRIHIYKAPEGQLTALVAPSPGKGKAPVLLQDITAENVVSKVLPAVKAMREPKVPRPRQVSLL